MPARSLYAVLSSPIPGRESEYERWYDTIHAPDSLALGIFSAARRFAALGASRAAYLTLWESDDPDPAAALERVRPAAQALRERGRVWPVQRILFQQFLSLRAADSLSAGAAPAATLTTLLGCWAEPASDRAFRAWYVALVKERTGPLGAYESRREYGAKDKTLVLLESSWSAERLEPLWADLTEPGLPPFGEPTPIFPAGESPQQYAEPERVSAAQLARFRPGWAAHWRLVASYT